MMASPVVLRVSPVRFRADTRRTDGSRKRPVYPTEALKAGDKVGVLEIVVQFYKAVTVLHAYPGVFTPHTAERRNTDSATFPPEQWTMDASSLRLTLASYKPVHHSRVNPELFLNYNNL